MDMDNSVMIAGGRRMRGGRRGYGGISGDGSRRDLGR